MIMSSQSEKIQYDESIDIVHYPSLYIYEGDFALWNEDSPEHGERVPVLSQTAEIDHIISIFKLKGIQFDILEYYLYKVDNLIYRKEYKDAIIMNGVLLENILRYIDGVFPHRCGMDYFEEIFQNGFFEKEVYLRCKTVFMCSELAKISDIISNRKTSVEAFSTSMIVLWDLLQNDRFVKKEKIKECFVRYTKSLAAAKKAVFKIDVEKLLANKIGDITEDSWFIMDAIHKLIDHAIYSFEEKKSVLLKEFGTSSDIKTKLLEFGMINEDNEILLYAWNFEHYRL